MHAPGMPGTLSPSPRASDPDMHHGTCVTHVPWCMPGSLTSGFLWSRLRGKRSRHSRRMRNPQYYVSGKRPIKSHDEQSDNQNTDGEENKHQIPMASMWSILMPLQPLMYSTHVTLGDVVVILKVKPLNTRYRWAVVHERFLWNCSEMNALAYL